MIVELVEEAARVQKLVGDPDRQVGVVRVVVVGHAPHHLQFDEFATIVTDSIFFLNI